MGKTLLGQFPMTEMSRHIKMPHATNDAYQIKKTLEKSKTC